MKAHWMLLFFAVLGLVAYVFLAALCLALLVKRS